MQGCGEENGNLVVKKICGCTNCKGKDKCLVKFIRDALIDALRCDGFSFTATDVASIGVVKGAPPPSPSAPCQPRRAASRRAAPEPRHAAPRHAAPRHAAPRHAAPRHAAPKLKVVYIIIFMGYVFVWNKLS